MKHSLRSTAITTSTAVVTLFLLGHAPTLAQTAPGVTTLEPIIVTGRKRDETEARLPMSTKTLDQTTIPSSTLDTGAAIARAALGTNFTDLARFGDSYLTMRGVATLGAAQNPLDSTVGYSIDGVATSLSGLGTPLIDIERIEVFRGPQGTTFGRNALGGAINVVSKPADGTREFRLDAEGGSDSFGMLQGTAGGWLIPNMLAGRGVLRFENFGGDIPNSVLGGHDGDVRIGAGRAALRLTPDDTLTIDLTGSFSRNRRQDPSNILLEAPGFPISGADTRPFNQQELANGALTVKKDFELFSVTSVTSDQDIKIRSDNDYSDAIFYGGITGFPSLFVNPGVDYLRTSEDEKLFNQEIRANSAEDSPMQWVVGASYFHSNLGLHRDMANPTVGALSPQVGILTNGQIDNKIKSETWAIFADGSVPLDDQWQLSGGLRLAHDRQKLTGLYKSNGFPSTMPLFAQQGAVSDTYITGRLALSYQWNADLMSYASVSRGYGSGGFEKATVYAPIGVATQAFAPATSWTYEIGTKLQATENLRLSGNLFFNDVKDGQLSAFDSFTMTQSFASQDYQSYGFEADMSLALDNGVELFGGFAAIKSELVDINPMAAMAGALGGNKVPQVPSFSANIGVNYRFDAQNIGLNGEIFTSASLQFVGERYSDIANTGKLASYQLANTKIGWEKDNIAVYAFANNLFDERPVHYAVPVMPGVSAAYVGRGRVIGLGTSIKF